MNNRSKRGLLVAVAWFAFLVAEAGTLYAYSLVWITAAQPHRDADPTLSVLAWCCVVAVPVWFVTLMYSLAQIYRRFP
jgi:hypothetical protein